MNQLKDNPETLAIENLQDLPATHIRSKSNSFILGEK